MSALIKAVAGVLVLSGFAGGGYLIYDSTLRVVYPLSSLEGFATKYQNTTFGGKYGRYMLDPARNKNAWNEAYKRWSSSTATKSAEFTGNDKVTAAYHESTATALNKVCEAAFNKQSTDVKSGTNTNYENDVWTYCSIVKEKPKTISENTSETYTDAKIGSSKKTTLVSTEYSGNSIFWDIRNEEFYSSSGSRSGKDLDTAKSKSKFKIKYDAGNKSEHIKDICKAAYLTDSSNNTEYPSDDVVKFCTLDGSN